MPGLSIIIVNYRSSSLLIEAIRTLEQFNNNLDHELIVVDNASGDNSRQSILEKFPQVKWIDMGYNAGFARGNNAGMKLASGGMILLLNPDTICIDDSISQCYKRLLSSEFVSAGVQQVNEDGSLQISGNFFMKGGLNHLLPIPYWGGFLR